MARTVDFLIRLDMKVNGVHQLSVPTTDRKLNQTITAFYHATVEMTPSTTNNQIILGSNFSTPIWGVLQSQAGSFTYSRGANNLHHPVRALGTAAWEGLTASLYLSNNSTVDTARVEVWLGGD